MGFLSFTHDRQLDVGAPARTIRCTNSTESWMFILNQVGILYPFGVPSAPFDILVSHRLFSPASRCERCPFLDEVLYGIRNSYTMGCPPVRGDNPRALAIIYSNTNDIKCKCGEVHETRVFISI